MRRYEITDWLVMAGFCLFLFAIPYVGRYIMEHARAALCIIFAVGVLWFVTRR